MSIVNRERVIIYGWIVDYIVYIYLASDTPHQLSLIIPNKSTFS